MRPQPEVVVSLANTIIELKQKLAKAESDWDAMFDTASVTVTRESPVSRGRVANESSGAGRIRKLLAGSPDYDWTPSRVASTLGLLLGTTRTTLSKMATKGLIEKRGFSAYGAKTVIRENEEVKEETPASTGVHLDLA